MGKVEFNGPNQEIRYPASGAPDNSSSDVKSKSCFEGYFEDGNNEYYSDYSPKVSGKSLAFWLLDSLSFFPEYEATPSDYLNAWGERQLDKNNIVSFIREFYEAEGEGIIEVLDRRWGGPSVAEMEIIPNKLVDLAKSKGFKENEKPLKNLLDFLKDPSRVENGEDPNVEDYEKGRAEELDRLMWAVIVELEK